ncbi:MAG: hypothetical protein H7Y11_07130, partial [Armatimonadetes bacterium]|nr:hypothetical protein [Anaerolineae bacterium]
MPDLKRRRLLDEDGDFVDHEPDAAPPEATESAAAAALNGNHAKPIAEAIRSDMLPMMRARRTLTLDESAPRAARNPKLIAEILRPPPKPTPKQRWRWLLIVLLPVLAVAGVWGYSFRPAQPRYIPDLAA